MPTNKLTQKKKKAGNRNVPCWSGKLNFANKTRRTLIGPSTQVDERHLKRNWLSTVSKDIRILEERGLQGN